MSNPLRLPAPLQNWSLRVSDDQSVMLKLLTLTGPIIDNRTTVSAEMVDRGGQAVLDATLSQMVQSMQQVAITEFGLQPIIDEKIRQAQLALLNEVMLATYKRVDASMSIFDATGEVRKIWTQKQDELS